jgi:hypothetical protein
MRHVNLNMTNVSWVESGTMAFADEGLLSERLLGEEQDASPHG